MTLLEKDWDKMDRDDQIIAVSATLIAPPVSLDIWAKAASLPSVKVLQQAQHFIEQKVMKTYDPLGIGYYYFKDPDLIQNILGWFGADQTEKIARRLVDIVRSDYPEGPAQWMALAYIYQTAYIEPPDATVLIKAAEHCLELNLQEDASVYYQLVIDLMSLPPDDPTAKGAYIDAVIGLFRHSGSTIPLDQQQRLLSTALAYSTSIKDDQRAAPVLAYLGKVFKRLGNYDQAADMYDKAWQKASKTGSKQVKRYVALASTDFLFWQGRLSDAIKRYEYVLGNLEELPEDESSLLACAHLGWIYGKCGQTGRGIGLINSVLGKAAELKLVRLTIYAKVLSVNSLHDARKNAEAEPIIKELLEVPPERLDKWVLWPLYAARAYVYACRGEYQTSFEMQSKVYEIASQLGNFHHRGPINFESLDMLEENGFVHPQMNYDDEVKRVINWPDIYMQGVGYYYRARRVLKQNGSSKAAHDDLKLSISLLTQSGAKLDLAYSQILLGKLLIKQGCQKEAQDYLKKAWAVLRFTNERLFPQDLRSFVHGLNGDGFFLNPLIEISETLGSIRNRKNLLNHIITLTLQLTGAERGAFFSQSKQGGIEMIASRNYDPEQFFSQGSQRAMPNIKKVMETGDDIVKRLAGGANHSDQAAKKYSGWQITFPVKLQGKVLGAFLLERNLDGFTISERTRSLLKAISTQVAVALDNVQAYEKIAELKDQLEAETLFYRNDPSTTRQAKDIIGDSAKIKEVLAKIYDVAPSDSTVLIIGETGVGKELVAKAIHQLSLRSGGPFIPISITSLNENLISSELFGHEKGAFTNAMRTHHGRFELSNNGTLFLDEINSLSLDVQSKLLRVLEEKSFERVGGSSPIKTNFRLIAATNQGLDVAVKKGLFRPDLYYRLNVYPIIVPPLRERKEDIPTLVSFFVSQYNRKFDKDFRHINKKSMKSLMAYHWPGNVRELKHTVERAVLSCKNKLQLSFPNITPSEIDPNETRFMPLKENERLHILKALGHCNWKVSGNDGAAKLLGLHPQTLYSKIKRLGIKKNVSMV